MVSMKQLLILAIGCLLLPQLSRAQMPQFSSASYADWVYNNPGVELNSETILADRITLYVTSMGLQQTLTSPQFACSAGESIDMRVTWIGVANGCSARRRWQRSRLDNLCAHQRIKNQSDRSGDNVSQAVNCGQAAVCRLEGRCKQLWRGAQDCHHLYHQDRRQPRRRGDHRRHQCDHRRDIGSESRSGDRRQGRCRW